MEDDHEVRNLSQLPLEDAARVEKAVREKLRCSTELNVLVTGRFQVGKSSLINAMFFREGEDYRQRAEEGSQMTRCTDDVKPHTFIIRDYDIETKINIFDSPGLQDGRDHDKSYLRKMQEKCPKVHLIIYCTKMGDPIRPDEEKALSNITATFGEAIWKNVIVALTFANQVDPAGPSADEAEHFTSVLDARKRSMRECFERAGLEEVFDQLSQSYIHPVGSARKLILPSGHNWQAEFWKGCLDACQPEGKGALLKLASRNPHFLKLVGASVGTTSGGVAIVVGAGVAVAGGVMTATGLLAPVGVPLIAVGVVAALLGVGGTLGGAAGIKAAKKGQ